jgi:phenylacetate-coenzyme A ligase PaaK-like adenylate-forming protein
VAEEYWDEELDTKPWEEVQAWQRTHLAGFVTRLAERSPFFADRLAGIDAAEIDSPSVWSRVPFTTKDDLRAGQQDLSGNMLGLLQCVDSSDIVQVLASSGTTGRPVFFGLTEQDRDAWADSIANMFYTAGVRRSSVVALTTGMPLVAGGMPYADAVRRIGATLLWVGGQTVARMVSIVADLKVDTLIGTASFATFFAERCESVTGRPASELAIRTVIGGGEPGLGQEAIRSGIRRDWNADRVSEVMGLGDVMSGMWGECAEGNGMHFTASRNVYVELIDPETGDIVPWSADASGEAVYTPFTREATPSLRFRSRDHLQVMTVDCPCGRTSPVVRCVGRTDDMVIFKAMNVFPSAIRDVVMEGFASQIAGPLRLRKEHRDQVRFDDPIPLEVELPEGTSASEVGDLGWRMEEAVRERLRVRVAVELLERGSIPIGEYKNALTYVREPAGRA